MSALMFLLTKVFFLYSVLYFTGLHFTMFYHRPVMPWGNV